MNTSRSHGTQSIGKMCLWVLHVGTAAAVTAASQTVPQRSPAGCTRENKTLSIVSGIQHNTTTTTTLFLFSAPPPRHTYSFVCEISAAAPRAWWVHYLNSLKPQCFYPNPPISVFCRMKFHFSLCVLLLLFLGTQVPMPDLYTCAMLRWAVSSSVI